MSSVWGVDTNVLVHWAIADSPYHVRVRQFFIREISHPRRQLGLTQQVLYELLHVVTDGRRFERPLSMKAALGLARDLWLSPEVKPLGAPELVLDRTLELMELHQLGRKRILDTSLAAIMEACGVETLVTFNLKDFQIFPFLEAVSPLDES